MGTAKRERQKANRAQREQEIARAAARRRTTRLAILIGSAILAVFVLVFVAGQFVGDDDPADTVPAPVDTAVAPADSAAVVDTAVVTTPVAEPDTGTAVTTGGTDAP